MKEAEPRTDAEFETAIQGAGYELIDTESGFVLHCVKGGGQTQLESEDLSSALYEAWNLVKE